MFSAPFRAVFYVLAQAFMKLYHMPADWQPSDEHADMHGDEYLATLNKTDAIHPNDNPATGAELPDNRTNVPEQVFNSGADVAAVFNAPTLDEIGKPRASHEEHEAQPIYTMTAAANGFTREQYLAQPGWTDDLLVEHGMMMVSHPKPPAPPVAPPAPPAPPVVPTPPTASAPVAATAPAPATNPAPAPSGAVPLDKDGIPWDARIHSSSKQRNNDNSWKKKKGVGDAYYNQVKAELMQRGGTPFAAPQVAHVPLVPPAAPAAPAPAPAPVPSAPPGNASPEARAAIQQALADAAAVKGKVPTNGNELLTWASNNNAGWLFAATAQHVGMASFGFLVKETNPEIIGKAYKFMTEQIALVNAPAAA